MDGSRVGVIAAGVGTMVGLTLAGVNTTTMVCHGEPAGMVMDVDQAGTSMSLGPRKRLACMMESGGYGHEMMSQAERTLPAC